MLQVRVLDKLHLEFVGKKYFVDKKSAWNEFNEWKRKHNSSKFNVSICDANGLVIEQTSPLF